MEIDERTSSLGPAGIMAMACTGWSEPVPGWSEPVPGRELHPLKSSAFSRRTVSPTSV